MVDWTRWVQESGTGVRIIRMIIQSRIYGACSDDWQPETGLAKTMPPECTKLKASSSMSSSSRSHFIFPGNVNRVAVTRDAKFFSIVHFILFLLGVSGSRGSLVLERRVQTAKYTISQFGGVCILV